MASSKSVVPSDSNPENTIKLTSFLLIDNNGQMQVKDAEEFREKLGCGNNLVKIVSIFGKTGDGKSYTLNHTFFNGDEVFKTASRDQRESFTRGVWASYCSSLGIIAIETDGCIPQASNIKRKDEVLLKVLAISDVVIYIARAKSLPEDVFTFLRNASSVFTKHFSRDLQETSERYNIRGSLSVLGPAVVVFHETLHKEEPGLLLRSKFKDQSVNIGAFCCVRTYRTYNSDSTDFKYLGKIIKAFIQNSSIRVSRSPAVVFKAFVGLNDRCSGKIDEMLPPIFPHQYFRCSVSCKSCESRCSNSMNHEKDDVPHVSTNDCSYSYQYKNKLYLCKACFERGDKMVVTEETSDSSIIGYAKYAWSGDILKCSNCGVIYRSRQYWYGNLNPEETCVRTEIHHVWSKSDGTISEEYNKSQNVIDIMTVVSKVITDIGAKPAKGISVWITDIFSPSYFTPDYLLICCAICMKQFTAIETKHHCRICGGGFCEDCSSKTKFVPSWGSSVRVCILCFEYDDTSDAQKLHNPAEVAKRKVGEAFHASLVTVASVASYPLEIIKDYARPSYWVPDNLIKECAVCKIKFGFRQSKHHCRACGKGVCNECSKTRRPVPVRRLMSNVRVCDTCVKQFF